MEIPEFQEKMEHQAHLAKKENVVTRAIEGIMVILVPPDVMVPQDVMVLQVSICFICCKIRIYVILSICFKIRTFYLDSVISFIAKFECIWGVVPTRKLRVC